MKTQLENVIENHTAMNLIHWLKRRFLRDDYSLTWVGGTD